MPADVLDVLSLAEQLVAFGELSDDLLGGVPTSLHVVWSSFPMMGHRTRTTGGSAHGDPVTIVRPAASLANPTSLTPRWRGARYSPAPSRPSPSAPTCTWR